MRKGKVDIRSEWERRLIRRAGYYEDCVEITLSRTGETLRGAAEVLGECRRAMELARGRLEGAGAAGAECGDAIHAIAVALARLEE